MKSSFSHLQFNIEPANRAFYKDLFMLLGWDPWHEDERMLGMGVEGKGSFWCEEDNALKLCNFFDQVDDILERMKKHNGADISAQDFLSQQRDVDNRKSAENCSR